MSAEREELLPCPFCGGDAEMDTQQSYRNISTARLETGVAIYCRECPAQVMLCRGDLPDLHPDEVIAIWNRRPAAGDRAEPGVCPIAPGFVMVPREPTEAMWIAYWRAMRLSPSELRAWLKSNLRNRGPHESGCVTAWHAMIEAAPVSERAR
jgi:hypothetical protein